MVNLNNLFLLIEKNGLTASKVASDTGISTGNISDWKKGRSLPTAVKLDTLATYLNCSVDYLLGRTDNPYTDGKKICNHGNSVAFGDSCHNNSVEIGNVKEHAESESKNEDEELLQLFHSLPIYLRAEFILAMHNKVIELQKNSDEGSDD